MEKTEELRQNWHITEMQHTWKARRALAKKNATDAIAKAKAAGDENVYFVDGKEIVMTVKVGDKVITGKYSGTEVKIDGEEYTIVRQSDILAIVE